MYFSLQFAGCARKLNVSETSGRWHLLPEWILFFGGGSCRKTAPLLEDRVLSKTETKAGSASSQNSIRRTHIPAFCRSLGYIRKDKRVSSLLPHLLWCALSCHAACATRRPWGFQPSPPAVSPAPRNLPFLITGCVLVDPLSGLWCFF